MPSAEEIYHEKLTLIITDSTQRIDLDVKGSGIKPELEIKNSAIELGPILPHATGVTADVIINNPSKLPVEFYSLDFDKDYLEEEKILREQKGYDKFGNLMLPPRKIGSGLPDELKRKPEFEIVDESESADQERPEIIEKHDPVQLANAKLGLIRYTRDFILNVKVNHVAIFCLISI